MSQSVFCGDWAEGGLEQLKRDFAIGDAELEGVHILAATYEYSNYEGSAYVLFMKGGKLYSVNAGHCSCYGLEDQWAPELVVPEADVKFRVASDNAFQQRIRELLGAK